MVWYLLKNSAMRITDSLYFITALKTSVAENEVVTRLIIHISFKLKKFSNDRKIGFYDRNHLPSNAESLK